MVGSTYHGQGRLKAEGVVKGYPDIMVFTEGRAAMNRTGCLTRCAGTACGCAIELKVWPNKPLPEQENCTSVVEVIEWRAAVLWPWSSITREYFGT